jgi:serine/threonine protein kinase
MLSQGSSPIGGYELIVFLGEGAFGQVWKAIGPGGIATALKFVRLSERVDETEARALDLIKNVPDHPNVISVRGIWEIEGYLVIAMSLADRTLMDRLAEARKQGLSGIPTEELLEYIADAARGIDYLNSLQIIHRDIKPQNMLLVGGRGLKIADFGLAKFQEKSLATNSGAMTPAFAPPEFFRRKTSNQSDQYSLAISYCLLRTGILPFQGQMAEMMAGHLNEPPDLSGLEEGEREILARALAKNPEQRWPSCRAFAQALQGHFGVISGIASANSLPPPLSLADRRRQRRILLGVALLGILAVSISSYFVWSRVSLPDPLVEMRRLEIEREVASMRSAELTVSKQHPPGYQEVEALPPFENSNFHVVSDERIVDYRLWKEVPADRFQELYSAVVSMDRIRLRKLAPVSTYYVDGRTSGRELFFNGFSPYPFTVQGQKFGEFVGNDRMRKRRLAIDVSTIPVNSDFVLRFSATRWNSDQAEQELWHGVVGYKGSFKVSLLLVFPDSKPFTGYRLMVSPTSRDQPKPYEGRKLVLAAADQRWLYWEIPNPEAGYVYRLHWNW